MAVAAASLGDGERRSDVLKRSVSTRMNPHLFLGTAFRRFGHGLMTAVPALGRPLLLQEEENAPAMKVDLIVVLFDSVDGNRPPAVGE